MKFHIPNYEKWEKGPDPPSHPGPIVQYELLRRRFALRQFLDKINLWNWFQGKEKLILFGNIIGPMNEDAIMNL